MSEWQEVTLGDVIQFQRGFDLTEKDAEPGPYPVISSGGISYSTSTPKVDGPGVVTGRKGVLGKVHFSEGPYWPHDTTLWVKDFKGSEPRFVYYWLQTLPIAGLDGGAANPTLNRNHAHLMRVRVPDRLTQRRIADILRALDDLIENNRRRIALLERMAQAIYREWFVHFRYPGHEHDELVDSSLGPIPTGWEGRSFLDLGTYLNGFAFKPAHWHDAGLPIVKIKELKQGVTSSTPRYHGDDIDARYLVERGDLLFSWSAYLDAYLWAWEPALLNQHLFKVTPAAGVAQSWLFLALRERMGEFRSRSQGTTMKHIKRAALDEVCVVTPTSSVMRALDERLRPILDQVLVLSAALSPLETLREMLLPKLVTGAIDVSHLDLDALLDDPAT